MKVSNRHLCSTLTSTVGKLTKFCNTFSDEGFFFFPTVPHLLCVLVCFQADQREEAEREFEKTTMAFFVIREGDTLSRALDISIVIDGVEVLNELPSVACACAIMFGFIYALNLKYPEGLKYTF